MVCLRQTVVTCALCGPAFERKVCCKSKRCVIQKFSRPQLHLHLTRLRSTSNQQNGTKLLPTTTLAPARTRTCSTQCAPDDGTPDRPSRASSHRRKLPSSRPGHRRTSPRIRVLSEPQTRKVYRLQRRLFFSQPHIQNIHHQPQPPLSTTPDRCTAEAVTGSHKY